MILRGNAWTFGDNVDTDVIIPVKYTNTTDSKEFGKHCMEGIDPDFPLKVKAGDIMVAKKNFGCGSSREQAPLALKHAGVKCVLAESIARIFYRNAITIGLPVLECPEGAKKVEDRESLQNSIDQALDVFEAADEQGTQAAEMTTGVFKISKVDLLMKKAILLKSEAEEMLLDHVERRKREWVQQGGREHELNIDAIIEALRVQKSLKE